MIPAASPEADLPLPPLREDLRLTEAAAGANGEPAWVIQDPILNRFYRIGWLEFEFLLRWGRKPAQVCEQIARETALRPELGQLLDFRRFLERHELLRPGAEALARLQAKSMGSAGSRWLTWRWWLHHYLFFRIPLVRPQAFLGRLAAKLDWLFSPLTGYAVVLLGLLGVALVLRQWDAFAAAVVESFTPEGLLGFALAILVAKTLHELGHALVATRMGLKVAHMGVAFVVLWPMLYTDTGESWKLRGSRHRLAIASAGILVELALAGLATLGWALCEPGALRNGMLYLATTSWTLSLALNASPFMRFDGYFILSDLLDFPNLHERSSALARTALRRGVLGLDESWPEMFGAGQRRALIAFAVTTWLYRLAVFLGIAVAVYLFFFKLLGIFLFAVEIWWFVALPVFRELKAWWAARAGVPANRRLLLLGFLGAAALLLVVPWRTQVHAVGMARSEHLLRVFAPFPARIQEIRAAGNAGTGEVLVVLEEPDIASRMRRSEVGLRAYEARMAGLIADAAGLDKDAATRERIRVEYEEAQAARSEIARLKLHAPFEGEWLDVNPYWRAGQWISSKEQVGVLIDRKRWQVDAYLAPDDAARIANGGRVLFYAEGVPQPIAGRVIAVGSTRVKQLAHPMLTSRFKGPLGVSAENDALKPTLPLFHVLVQLETAPPASRETRGQLQIDGERRSLLGEGMKRILAVLLRESGF